MTSVTEVVVRASPRHPPVSLPLLCKKAVKSNVEVIVSTHIHSSIAIENLEERAQLLEFLSGLPSLSNAPVSKLKITLVWTDTGSRDVQFRPSDSDCFFHGEVNLARYICDILAILNTKESSENSFWLDEIHSCLIWENGSTRKFHDKMAAWLKGHDFLSGNALGLPDLVSYAHLKGTKLPEGLHKWRKKCQSELENPNVNGGTEAETNGPKVRLFQFFQENSIAFENIEHPEVFTVETMMPYLKDVNGAVSKNLFLKDKKKGLYLLSAIHDRNVNLNDISKQIKAPGGGLRFASEEVLYETLGVKQGCVTAYALINDTDQKVKFLADNDLTNGNHPKVFFHPLVNSASTGISCNDFKKFVKLTGHTITPVTF